MKASPGRKPREYDYQKEYEKWPFVTLSFAIHAGIKRVRGRTETHTSTMFRTCALDVANRSMSIPASP
jgi:ribosomal protein S26